MEEPYKSAFNTQEQSHSVAGKIIVSLERISEAFRVLLWREGKLHNLSPLQIQLLIFLAFHSQEKCSVSYLASEFNMTKATVSDAVKVLLKKQLLEKEIHPEDARSYSLKLLPDGREIVKSSARFTQEIQTPIDKLDDEEKSSLLNSLLNIIKHLNKAGVITVKRMCFNCNYYSNAQGHYCNLLRAKLSEANLRIDCPEHVEKT